MSLQNPTDALAALVRRGQDALLAGDLTAARSCYEEAAVACATEPEAHNNLGALYMGLGEFELAAACFTRVIDMLPERPNARFNRGVARIRLGQADAALADFEAVLSATPDDAEAQNNLAVACFLCGRRPDARRAIARALEISPDFPNAVLNLCDIEIADGDLGAAISHCQEYLQSFRDPAVSRQLLTLLDRQAWHALEEAIPQAEELVAANADDLAARRHLGRLLDARQALCAEA